MAKWYGKPASKDVFRQIFEDAVYAWKTGEFGCVSAFQAEDSQRRVKCRSQLEKIPADEAEGADTKAREEQPEAEQDARRAEYGSIYRALVVSNSTEFV